MSLPALVLTPVGARSYPLKMNSSDFFAFLAIGSMIAVPILAHKKGRRWWAWLIPSIFFGPFMLIAVLLVKRKPSKVDAIVEEPREMQSHRFPEPSIPPPEQSMPAPVLLIEPESDEGYVYIISNPSIAEDLVKIGFTKRDPSERLKELDRAGLPSDYIEHYRVFTKDAQQLEARLHRHFAAQRYREDKEFFKLSPYEVYAVLQAWGVKSLEL
jgi:hypothetical protein